MRRKSEFLICRQTEADIRARIKKLSGSYTPEWLFDEKDPDAGSVIGLIFAHQMSENIRRLNQVTDKYRTELVNMLNISLKPAYPASGVVVMELVSDTIPGIDVPKGTKLLGQPSDDNPEQLVFETVSNIHVTNSRLTDVMMVSGSHGRIIPLMGAARRADIIPAVMTGGEGEGETPEGAPGPQESNVTMRAFGLFDFREEGIEQNGLMLYHSSLFDTAESVDIYIRFIEYGSGRNISGRFTDASRYRWSYFSGEEMRQFDSVSLSDGAVVLKKPESLRKITLDGTEYSMICLESIKPVERSVTLNSIEISSKCDWTEPAFIVSGDIDIGDGSFMPFGDTVSLFDECYIGHDAIFAQQGARVEMKFRLAVREKQMSVMTAEENDELKVIKRKVNAPKYTLSETSPQKVSIDYYNGIGWQRLKCDQDYSTLFDGSNYGEVSISFICPDDWQPTSAGAHIGRAIRLRVIQADNCYLLPCLHKAPEISDLRLSYSYFDNWKKPQRIRTVCGTEISDPTVRMLSGMPFTVFSPLPYGKNSLYLGFDRKFEGSPISIFFDIDKSVYFNSSPIGFEYSAPSGFKKMKVIDKTDNMSGIGTVTFIPPSDITKLTIEGQSRYWIRLTDEEGAFNDPERYHARIKAIIPNAVEVMNVETLPEESFYIDAVSPNMSFPIAAENILTAEVFVNEKNRHSAAEMQRMIREQPDDIRVEYDFLGDISEFFVRWTEVENFDDSTPTDRHYVIDRQTNTIRFGDGVNVMIPGVQSGVAFTVRAVCCAGARGNLPKGAISSTFGNILYLNRVYNPISTYAGSNIESVDNALNRGAVIINSKNRLVSETDFVREVKAFSTAIAKAKCIVGRDIDGVLNDRLISIVVMMSDYSEGSSSFNSISDRLLDAISSKCGATLPNRMIRLTEPIYAEISVDVYAELTGTDKSFDTQNVIKENIAAFLDPISGRSGMGWDIGQLPTERQIGMMLRSIKCDAFIKRYIVTARYVDKKGTHECNLEKLAENPFVIGVSGTHTVHMQFV